MKIVAISDTHMQHDKIIIPNCDVLIHAGDEGTRTDVKELKSFLIWFEKQPAKKKIFIAGNHSIILDYDWVKKQWEKNSVFGMIAEQQHNDAIELLKDYDVEYLLNSGFEYDGLKFWGSPYSPSLHREYWAFNADRGDEIQQYWDMIPKDTDVLIVHTPVKGIHDRLLMSGEHKGCIDLNCVVKDIEPSLFICGHIHEGYGYEINGKTTYVNASVLDYNYVLRNKPFLIEINTINEGFKEVKIINEGI